MKAPRPGILDDTATLAAMSDAELLYEATVRRREAIGSRGVQTMGRWMSVEAACWQTQRLDLLGEAVKAAWLDDFIKRKREADLLKADAEKHQKGRQ